MDAETLQRVDLMTVEAFVTKDSRYVGTTLDSIDFRRVHGFTVVGLAHRGRRLRENLMASRLSIGDSLLLLGNREDLEQLESNPNLVVLGKEPFAAIGKRKALIVTVLLAGIVFGAISGLLAPPLSIPLAAACAVLLGCVHVRDAYDAIDLRSILTVAGMIPFATALEKSGAAQNLATAMVTALHGHGPYPLLGGILLLAVISTQVIENAAVAIILAPLAFNVAQTTGVDPKPFLVGLGVCVSAAFCTPFAHESTLLVMQPGRYEFKHYLRLGGFLAVLTWGLATWLTPLVWRFSTPA
jgi:di/tricarboxylate transporter